MARGYGHNASPMRYITRLGNGWTVRVPITKTKGKDYNRFPDRDYGSSDDALRAAQAYRDKQAEYHQSDIPTLRRKRLKSKSRFLPTGVFETHARRVRENGAVSESLMVVASHPTIVQKVRSFAYAITPIRSTQRTRDEAVKLAIRQRKKWEKEEGIKSP